MFPDECPNYTLKLPITLQPNQILGNNPIYLNAIPFISKCPKVNLFFYKLLRF
jgi:hypothetical protein